MFIFGSADDATHDSTSSSSSFGPSADCVTHDLDQQAADCKPSPTSSAPIGSVDIAPVSVSGQCVGVINGSQSAHLSCRPFTYFTNVVYASGSEDPRNETFG